MDEPLVVAVVGPGDPLVTPTRITLDALADRPLMCLPKHSGPAASS
ncbi:hypothetical protein ABZ746_30980 [Streptomyces sp. NPDC020096]